jgi:putative transcriptional regulator
MTCHACGGRMTAHRRTHPYTESGLPNVVLHDIEVRRCTACAEEDLVLPRLAQLHRLIAHTLATKPSRLRPEEVRFLRKHIGWSGVEFAKHMGVTPSQVSRWENGDPMSAQADRLVRALWAMTPQVRSYPLELELFADLSDESEPVHIDLAPSKDGWRVAA